MAFLGGWIISACVDSSGTSAQPCIDDSQCPLGYECVTNYCFPYDATTGIGDGDPGDGDPGDGDGGGGICGNAMVDGNEECDDGNAIETDACVPGCTNNVCGDGFVHAGVEGCDDGNTQDDDGCSAECTGESCGDGVVQPGEDCDDANSSNTDDCTNLCASPTCGDGFVWANNEECDDANPSSTDDCTNSCTVATCGDGFVWANNEECDDGNSAQTDACLNSCVDASCGDGLVWQGTEECDDANNVQTDACTNSCDEATCGDGFIQNGVEECDDSNQANNDGCSSVCAIERLYVFVTSDSYTGNLGGIAGADAKCQMLADSEGLPGTYLAWLSTAQVSPSSRFTHSNSQYWLVDGTKIADNWADLTDGTLDAPIDLTEAGDVMTNTGFYPCNGNGYSRLVFTNTRTDGTLYSSQYSCLNWTASGYPTYFGRNDQSDGDWTFWCLGDAGGCQYYSSIYCFQQ